MTSDEIAALDDDHEYMVLWNGAAWFVKTIALFREQRGDIEPWGMTWSPVYAASIEEARDLAKIKWGPRGELWP